MRILLLLLLACNFISCYSQKERQHEVCHDTVLVDSITLPVVWDKFEAKYDPQEKVINITIDIELFHIKSILFMANARIIERDTVEEFTRHGSMVFSLNYKHKDLREKNKFTIVVTDFNGELESKTICFYYDLEKDHYYRYCSLKGEDFGKALNSRPSQIGDFYIRYSHLNVKKFYVLY